MLVRRREFQHLMMGRTVRHAASLVCSVVVDTTLGVRTSKAATSWLGDHRDACEHRATGDEIPDQESWREREYDARIKRRRCARNADAQLIFEVAVAIECTAAQLANVAHPLQIDRVRPFGRADASACVHAIAR